MSVEDRAKELNNLAERIKGSFTNFNSEFKKLSQKTTRIQRNVTERKERSAKLKSTSSSFGRSVDNVKSKVCLLYTSPSPRDLSTSRMPSSA